MLLSSNGEGESLEHAKALFITSKTWIALKKTEGDKDIDQEIAENVLEAERILMKFRPSV